MPFPVVMAAGLGAKLLGGWLKGRGQKKAAKSQEKNQRELLAAREKRHGELEARRGSKLDAIQAAIGNVGGALTAGGAGAPSYAFDPAVLERMKLATSLGETAAGQNVGANPSAGLGSSMLGGFASGLGDVALNYAANRPGVEGGVPAGVVPMSMDNPELLKPQVW